MSNETTAVETGETIGGRKTHDEHGHITEFGYVRIFIILAIITAVEVVWSYYNIEAIFIPVLFLMMIVKFWLVAAEFMHLKYDVKVFAGFFVTGLVLAGGVYLIFLSASQIWQSF